MQPRLHGFRLQAEKIGRLLHAHAFDDARHEHRAEGIGKRVDRLFQHRPHFALRHGLLRIAGRRRDGKMNDLGLVAVLAIGFPLHRRPPAPQSSKRFVHGDARNPGAEGGVAAKHVEAGEGADIGFLHDVFGFRVIAQDAARNAEQAAVVPAGDGANGGLVARARQIDQILDRPAYPAWACWACVSGIVVILRFDALDASAARKVPGVAAIKIVLPARHPSWIRIVGAFAWGARRNRLRPALGFGGRGPALDQFRRCRSPCD